jgi:large subunit ribosomal protein L24e
MAASRAKLLAHRAKKKAAISDAATSTSIKLVQPMSELSVEPEKIREKVKVSSKKSALIPGEGRSMGMDLD